MTHSAPLLEVRHVSKEFVDLRRLFGRGPSLKAVSDVSFDVSAGQTFSLVGESGSGKSTVANLVLGLLKPSSGEILFRGTRLTDMTSIQKVAYRQSVQAVFQDPFASLNPRMRIGEIVAEPLLINGVAKKERLSRTEELVEGVGVPATELRRYPHELSGGQRQRIGIARALALDPALIVLDEPVSALDVSVRSQVLNLLADIQMSRSVAYLLISHDLPSVQHMSQAIGVMYLGRLVELGSEAVCHDPKHPYTATLIAAATSASSDPPWPIQIVGEIPDSVSVPAGCVFHPRCPYAFDRCLSDPPELVEVSRRHSAACHLYPDRIRSIRPTDPSLPMNAQ